jgi:hypothetical protein
MQINSNSAAADASIYTEFEEDGGAKLHFTTTKSGTGQKRMAIDSDGNVGIGTSSPVNSLHVLSSALIENDTDSNGAEAGLFFKVDSQDTAARRKGAIIFQRTGTAGIGDMYFCADGTSDGGDATTAADAKMVIKGAGNVLFPTANSKISGSATSTGSFGKIEAASKIDTPSL